MLPVLCGVCGVVPCSWLMIGGFVLALVLMYSMTSLFLKYGDAAMFDLSMLTR